MNKVLLTSSEYIKSHTGLNDNTYDKMILPALERVQDIELCEVLGDCMVKALQEKVDEGVIGNSDNTLYNALLSQYVQPFLAYAVMSNIVLELGQVMGNGGVDTLTDEHRQSLTFEERGQLQDYWKRHADSYKGKLQAFCKEHFNELPELKSCSCYNQHANLESSASTSIWLGGARGKRVRIYPSENSKCNCSL